MTNSQTRYHATLSCSGVSNPPMGQYINPGAQASWSGVNFTKNDFATSNTISCQICYRNIYTNNQTCDSFTINLGISACKCSDLTSPQGTATSSTQPTCASNQTMYTWQMGGSAGTCYSCEYNNPVVALGPMGMPVWIG